MSDPSAPALVGSLYSQGIANDVAVSGHLAYLATKSGGLRVIDVTTPWAPYKMAYYDALPSVEGVTYSGGHSFLATSNGGYIVGLVFP